MSEHPAAGTKGGLLTWALWGAALIGVAAVLYIIVQASIKPGLSGGDLKGLAHGEMAKLAIPDQPMPPPPTVFNDAQGQPHHIADFRGKVTLVNIWATWCGPCVLEMPTLAKLQAAYAGKAVAVVPVSIDTDKDLDKAKAFIAGKPPLAFYNDPGMKLPFDLKPQTSGMPTTIIYGADGVEKARLAGGADWSGPDARKVVDKLLADAAPKS
jgi:thiol-disulfide isomerase/thioredoxin